MSTPRLLTELRCEFSSRFPIAKTTIELARYRLKLLPTRRGGPQEGILEFEDEVSGSHSNPEHEGEIALSILSLLFNCRVYKTGYRANGLDITGHSRFESPSAEAVVDPTGAGDTIESIFTFTPQLTVQFIRACNAYSLALHARELDRTLAFLLLVTSLECLSSQEEFIPNAELSKSAKSTERYVRLVQTFCFPVEDLYPNGDSAAFIRNLKTVYFSHRSGFVHGGKEVSIASDIADRAGFSQITHLVDGKDVSTPGLDWFFEVARRSLLGFLKTFPRDGVMANYESLADIARNRAVLTMRLGAAESPKREA